MSSQAPPPLPLRSPTLASSSELASPGTAVSSRSFGRHRRQSSAVEPFPSLDSDATASSVDSVPQIPRITLLGPNARSPLSPLSGDGPFSSSSKDQEARHRGTSRSHSRTPRPAEQPLQSQSDHTDALWAEMQATLADVEISASHGAQFFGDGHAAALEQLRTAQLALAQAWARGEDSAGGVQVGFDQTGSPRSRTSGANSDLDDDDASPGASIRDADAATDADGEAARRRREANDKYFARIQQSVAEVVDKLENVAMAMGRVERESREIWSSDSDLESLNSGR